MMRLVAVFLVLTAFSDRVAAQQFALDPVIYHVFDKDSLAGFDEQAAGQSAISEHFTGAEYPVRMYQLKRRFINNKYNLWPAHTHQTHQSAAKSAVVAGCTNEDFEASSAGTITASGQVAGWTVTRGSNNPSTNPNANSCNLLGCCPAQPLESAVFSAPNGYIDPIIGSIYPIYSVFGSTPGDPAGATTNSHISQPMMGDNFIRINSSALGTLAYSIERLSKTFSVTPNNAIFQFAFISVFSTGHGCCDAGAFQIRLINASANTVIACPSFSASALSSACSNTNNGISYLSTITGTPASPTQWQPIFNKWQLSSMDLTAYIGQNITIEIVATDCTASGHYGYVYFDAQCGPMTIIGNGNEFPAGSTNVTVPTCGASGATMCATPGLGPYSWAGADVVPPYNTPSMSNQCFTSTLSTTYTLYMNPPGACAPIERVITTTVTPAPLLAGSVVQAKCGDSTAVISVTPSGSAGNPAYIKWSPAPFSLNTSTTIGTYQIPNGPAYNVSITASDQLGCKVVTVLPVNPAPPIPTFTINNFTSQQYILTCQRDSIYLGIASSYTYGTLNYFWSSNSYTSTAADATIHLTMNPTPRTYTVKATDPVTQCSVTKTFSMGVNTAFPTSTINPTFQNITCVSGVITVSAYANPSVNVRHTIKSPLMGPIYSSTSYSTSYVPGFPGTYTHVTTNEVNGCELVRTFTVASNDVFPTFDAVSSPPNFTLGCGTKSIITVNILNAQLPPGGPVTMTLLTPTSSSVLPSGALSSVNSFTNVNVPGTWTIVVRASGSGCDTKLPISILSNTFAPSIDSMVIPRNILNCASPRTTLKGISFTPNIKYTWSFKGPGSQLGDTLTVYANFAARTATTVDNYTLTIEDNNSTCKNTTIIPIYQNIFPPIARIGSTGSLTCLTNTIELTNQSNPNIPLSAPFPTNPVVVGSIWRGPSPQVPAFNKTSYVASQLGEYTLTATNIDNGCSSVTTAIVGEDRKAPLINTPVAPPPPVLDCGASQTTASVIVTTGTANLSYQWTAPAGFTFAPGSDKQPGFKVSQVGEYKVTVTDTKNGCAAEANVQVTNGALTAQFEADRQSGFAPMTVTFNNRSRSSLDTVNVRTVWTFGNGTTANYTTTSVDPQTVYTQAGTYTVTMYASKGTCLETYKRVITVEAPSEMIVPNIFSPNGDGANDLFILQRSTNLSSITAEIFNRWGHKVYEVKSDKQQIEWDGTNMYGKEAPEGTYFYIIKAIGKDGAEYDKKGTITLVR